MKKLLNFRNLWFMVFIGSGVGLSIAWGDTPLGLIAFLSGMVCVFLAAVGSRHTYSVGVLNCVTYGYVALTAGLNGEMQLNWFFYLPLQFIGFFLWSKHLNRDKTVERKGMTLQQFLGMYVIGCLLTYFYSLYLGTIDGQATPLIDAFTTVFSIIASILMLLRYREFWNCYISVNIMSVLMWSSRLVDGVQDAATMLVMWTAFLVNSVYGAYVWYKRESK